jgi:hypothetical protein
MSLLEFATALQATALSTTLQSIAWMVPLVQSIHILMVGVVFVSVLVVALRVLGKMRADEPLAEVWRRFAPFLWVGLLVMALTGTLLTIAEPVREFMTLSFRLKLVLLVIGIGSAAAFGGKVRSTLQSAEASAIAPTAALRATAVGMIVLWVAIIFLGRAIAYDDSVWGSWSPAVLQRGAGS